MSYQREDERYWTDYLRVALPIVGLLLLFGLLWFWLSSIIGDDNNDKPTATATVAVAIITQPVSTATTPPNQGITATVEVNQPTQAAGEPTNTPEENPTEAPQQAAKFAKGDTVVTTEDHINVRSDPSTSSDDNVLESLDQGAELTITGKSKEADGYTWWPVEDDANVDANGDPFKGWVVEDFIEPS